MGNVLVSKKILQYRERVLLSALQLEIAGMKKTGKSCYQIIKEEYGLKGNRQSVYKQFKELVEQKAKERSECQSQKPNGQK